MRPLWPLACGLWPMACGLAMHPETRELPSSETVQPDVNVVAVRGRVVDVESVAVLVVTDRVLLHPAWAAPPCRAVPDQLLDAHATGERVLVAQLVRRQEARDQPLGLLAAGGGVDVEVPVDRGAVGVQAVVVRAELLAAHDAPEDARRVVLEPVLHGECAWGGGLGAAAREVVAVALDRQLGERVRRVALHGAEGLRIVGEGRASEREQTGD